MRSDKPIPSPRPHEESTFQHAPIDQLDHALDESSEHRHFPTQERHPPRGTPVGRYILLEPVSSGSVGTVYTAYDPELDRKLAVKLLRVDLHHYQDPAEAEVRIQREARSMARLSHPNVVQVYDTGRFGTQHFIAMEFVSGNPLKQWMQQPHSLQEILQALLQAGRGLQAAHEAGLIHRDFKPANVLQREDGTFCVVDFGLARGSLRQPNNNELSTTPSGNYDEIPDDYKLLDLDISLTEPGQIMGTPAYMAPEQLNGQESDERTDQFAFCVSLYEALYGERPFFGHSLEARTQAHLQVQQIRSIKGFSVPKWLRSLLQRGLAPQREDRFPTMRLLLDEIESSLRRQREHDRWRWLALIWLFLFAVGLSWLAFLSPSSPCQQAHSHTQKLWNPTTQHEIRTAFLQTRLHYALPTWERAQQALSSYEDAWRNQYTEACQATHLHKEQPLASLALRTQCLHDRLQQFSSLVSLFRKADSKIVEGAIRSIYQLDPLDECKDLLALKRTKHPLQDPKSQQTLQHLHKELSVVKALHDTGKSNEAYETLLSIIQQSRSISYPPLQADILYRKATLLHFQGKNQDAFDTAQQALWIALRLNDIRLQVLLYLELHSIAQDLARYPDAERFGMYAESLLPLLKEPALMQLRLDRTRGVMAFYRGQYPQALQMFLRAYKAANRHLNPTHPQRGHILNALGAAYRKNNQPERAIHFYQRAIHLTTQAQGPDHPFISTIENNLANIFMQKQQHHKALQLQKNALRRIDGIVPESHSLFLYLLGNMGMTYTDLKRWKPAKRMVFRAHQLIQKHHSKEHPRLAASYNQIGYFYLAQRRYKRALPAYQHASDIYKKRFPKQGHPQLAEALYGLAESLFFSHQHEAAKLSALHAEELFARFNIHDHYRVRNLFLLAHIHHKDRTLRPLARPFAEKARSFYPHLPQKEIIPAYLRNVPH
ncbi:serine/threonine-protein kinase [Myxococcota bacterium]|nr:serine/threonine-protein kinase [Myxococcota bacterium]